LPMISRRLFTSGVLVWTAVPTLAGTDKRRILVHGHRGARARRPENTLPAFRYALAQGVDVLELDVAVTKDDIAVVSHDPLVNSTICSGSRLDIPIRTLTLAQVREYDCGGKRNPRFADQQPVPGTRIPTLDEVFALGKGNAVQFNVETKIFAAKPELTPGPEEFTKLILDCARRNGMESRFILQSFDPRTLRVMKRLAPSVPRAALFEKQQDWMEVAQEFDATILSPEFHLVTADLVAKAHAAGLQVVPWTSNQPAEWAALVAAGSDAIISDDPAALIAWLKTQGLR
jgi:glycerophosphoryl diester phosphodiesterase